MIFSWNGNNHVSYTKILTKFYLYWKWTKNQRLRINSCHWSSPIQPLWRHPRRVPNIRTQSIFATWEIIVLSLLSPIFKSLVLNISSSVLSQLPQIPIKAFSVYNDNVNIFLFQIHLEITPVITSTNCNYFDPISTWTWNQTVMKKVRYLVSKSPALLIEFANIWYNRRKKRDK